MTKRVLQAHMEISAALTAIKRSESEAQRDRKPVPRWLMDKLQSSLTLGRANLFQAECAEYAMNRFPPLRF